MSEPSDIEILQRNAARIRIDIKRALAWMTWFTLTTIIVMAGNMAAIVLATIKYDPPGGLMIGLCVMTLIFIDGMHDKVKVQRERVEMLHTALDQLEANVRALGGQP